MGALHAEARRGSPTSWARQNRSQFCVFAPARSNFYPPENLRGKISETGGADPPPVCGRYRDHPAAPAFGVKICHEICIFSGSAVRAAAVHSRGPIGPWRRRLPPVGVPGKNPNLRIFTSSTAPGSPTGAREVFRVIR